MFDLFILLLNFRGKKLFDVHGFVSSLSVILLVHLFCFPYFSNEHVNSFPGILSVGVGSSLCAYPLDWFHLPASELSSLPLEV